MVVGWWGISVLSNRKGVGADDAASTSPLPNDFPFFSEAEIVWSHRKRRNCVAKAWIPRSGNTPLRVSIPATITSGERIFNGLLSLFLSLTLGWFSCTWGLSEALEHISSLFFLNPNSSSMYPSKRALNKQQILYHSPSVNSDHLLGRSCLKSNILSNLPAFGIVPVTALRAAFLTVSPVILTRLAWWSGIGGSLRVSLMLKKGMA
jgi:hypothetical protein